MTEVRRDLWRYRIQPLAQAEPAKAGCSGICPDVQAFDCLQAWRLYNLLGQPVQILSHPHSKKKVFPDVQRDLPVFLLVPITSASVTGHHRAEPSSVPSTPSLQLFIYIHF